MSFNLDEWIAERKAILRAKEQAKIDAKNRRAADRERRKRERWERRIKAQAADSKQSVVKESVGDPLLKHDAPAVVLTPEQRAEVGKRIEGSRFVRDFCCVCGEAMRVATARDANTCLDCSPTGVPGKRRGRIESVGMAYHGGQFNDGEW